MDGDVAFEYGGAGTYYLDDSPVLEEGAVDAWLYLHNGPGPAQAIRVVAFTDPDGHGFVQPQGEWQSVTVVDDR